MIIVIKKNSNSEQIELARKCVVKISLKKQGVAQSFGALKRNLDGLKYQKAVRVN